jgi:biotin carboxylase
VTARPHIVVIHRWRARYAEYERYVDHTANSVTYVTTEVGASAIPAAAADITLVDATDDLAAVSVRVKQLAEVHGHPVRIIALKEDDLLVAAELREAWGCAGPTTTDLLRFRDKFIMAEAVAAAGVELPPFALVTTPDAVRAFAAVQGWPVIVKPRIGSSSAGVSRLDGPDDCATLDFDADGELMVQAYDGRQIYHVDGYFDGTDVGPYRASRYVNTCLGFRHGDVLGSVEEDDPMIVASIGAFAARAMAALTHGQSMFHLEVFVDRQTGECAFLEVGARVGGAEIPFVWRELHGYDLMETGFRLGLGVPTQPAPATFRSAGGEIGGWLLVPTPAARPCRVSEATSMLGRGSGPYAEEVLRPGDIIPAADAYYEHVGGRFRFRAASSSEVEAAIVATARDYRITAQPLP